MAALASPLFHSLSKGPQSIGQTDLSLLCDDGTLRCHSTLFVAACSTWQTLLEGKEEEHTVQELKQINNQLYKFAMKNVLKS